jgi:hypothetical protein
LANPYFAPQETQKEIFLLLNNDTALTALIGANKVFDFVPDKKAFPYVTLYILPFVERDNYTHEGFNCEFQINVFYQPGPGQTGAGNKKVQEIQKRIDEILNKKSICIDGWNTLECRRSFIDISTDEDNVTKQGIQRFRLMLGSKT